MSSLPPQVLTADWYSIKLAIHWIMIFNGNRNLPKKIRFLYHIAAEIIMFISNEQNYIVAYKNLGSWELRDD